MSSTEQQQQQQQQQPQPSKQQFTDEELDREWKPNGRRPQSTLARSFSAELMDIFRIDDSVEELDSKVDKRKQTISMQTHELQSLEARLREMEERIKSAGTSTPSSTSNSPPQNQRQLLDDAPTPPPKNGFQQSKPAPASLNLVERGGKRPVGGIMPPTPGASEDGDRE